MSHQHQVRQTKVRPFFGPVSPEQNRAAHGHRTLVEICTCEATRKININGRHEERGPWKEDQ